MATLYNCHTDGDQYRITKFDSLGNVESTYLCTIDECECPAGFRPTCRHRHMLPRFLAKGAVNSFYFYDYDRQGWVTNEPAVAKDPMFKPAEPAKPQYEEPEGLDEGEEIEGLDEPAIATMHTIPDDADVAEEFAKLLHPEPTPTPPEPTLRRRI